MKQVYDLQVTNLYDTATDETCGYCSKGHHDREAFVNAVLEQHGVIVHMSDVQHKWVKVIPVKSSFSDVTWKWFDEQKKGACPVTIINTED